MSVLIFMGPTLPTDTARKTLDAVYLPPVGHGDIYRATLMRPKPLVIGLVDGYFRHQPAVRHKEILWAMSEGIHVFGAASIGALRAAELAAFGMIGIGQIYEDYAAGRLEDDDEVAVDHGPQELGYPLLNKPMVDVRATLERARQEGVIGTDCELTLIGIAKEMFYARREYATLLALARDQGANTDELERLQLWIGRGKFSLKRKDALAMLRAIRDFAESHPGPFKAGFQFERTEMWDADMELAAAVEGNVSGQIPSKS
jgi:hypothetical protein